MNIRSTVISVSLVLGIGIAAAGSAIAQGMMDNPHHGMMGRGMMQGDTDQMGRGAMQGGTGRGTMDGGMMRGAGGDMNCPMMGGMMQGRQSMMGRETMRGRTGGMSSLFGSRVVPTMNLSVDDVRGYLTAQLDRLSNKRLKIGNINAEGGSITAEIVTVDNSLVQRMKVDRSTGNIDYEN